MISSTLAARNGLADLAGYPLAFFDMGSDDVSPIQRMIFDQMNGLRSDLQNLSTELKAINAFIEYTKGENLRGQIAIEAEARRLLEARVSSHLEQLETRVVHQLETRVVTLERNTTSDSGAKNVIKTVFQIGAWVAGIGIALWAAFKK